MSGRDSYSDENSTLVVVFMSRITSYLSEALLKLNDYAVDYNSRAPMTADYIVQELCESRGGRPGLSVLTSLLVSVDVKLY